MTEQTISPSITAKELAALVGLSVRQVHALAQNGVFEAETQGRYSTRRAVGAYIDYLRSRRGHDELDAAKLSLAQNQAAKIEIQNARARGELVAAEEVRRAWTGIAADLRASILAIPSRLASRLGMDRTAQAELDAEMRLALESISARGSDDDLA